MYDLYFNNDEFLNVEDAAGYMHTDCLDRAVDDSLGDNPTDTALINLAIAGGKVLRENLLAF